MVIFHSYVTLPEGFQVLTTSLRPNPGMVISFQGIIPKVSMPRYYMGLTMVSNGNMRGQASNVVTYDLVDGDN